MSVSINTIHDLHAHLAQEGEHAIMTGTFDPPHRGHAGCIRTSFLRIPHLSSFVIIPHSWSKVKSPLNIEVRRYWMRLTLREFLPDLLDRIYFCHDKKVLSNPQTLDHLCNKYENRLYRIAGNDKNTDELQSRNRATIIICDRTEGTDSSIIIRTAIKENRIENVRNLVAPEIFNDIISNGHYH